MSETESWTSVLVGLGANEGDRKANIEKAIALVGAEPTIRWGAISTLRETEPVGGPADSLYLNGAGELLTCLSPWALLAVLQRIEAQLGRVRTVRHGPRPIDLDILTYGSLLLDTDDLTIPHPLMCERAFVLEPLAEIVPDRVHPATGRTIGEHLAQLVARNERQAPSEAE